MYASMYFNPVSKSQLFNSNYAGAAIGSLSLSFSNSDNRIYIGPCDTYHPKVGDTIFVALWANIDESLNSMTIMHTLTNQVNLVPVVESPLGPCGSVSSGLTQYNCWGIYKLAAFGDYVCGWSSIFTDLSTNNGIQINVTVSLVPGNYYL
jgi:hypothetical protein